MPRAFVFLGHALVAVSLAALAVVLLGDAPLLIGTPSVVVYPLTANDSSIDREASARIATAIAQRIAAEGGVKVLPPQPGADRTKFLTEARAAGADYYITGFASGLGNGVSLVLQLVSVQNGIVVYSASSQVVTYADAAGQGDVMHGAILRHAERSVAQIEALPSAVLPTPSPGPSGVEADVGKLLSRRNRSTPAPAPAPAAVAVAPASLALVPLTGSADAAQRDAARHALAQALAHGGVHAVPVDAQAPAEACTTAGNAGGVLGGTLDIRTEGGLFGRSATATIRLIGHDCKGNVTYDKTVARAAGGAQGSSVATEHAADAALDAYLHPATEKR